MVTLRKQRHFRGGRMQAILRKRAALEAAAPEPEAPAPEEPTPEPEPVTEDLFDEGEREPGGEA